LVIINTHSRLIRSGRKNRKIILQFLRPLRINRERVSLVSTSRPY